MAAFELAVGPTTELKEKKHRRRPRFWRSLLFYSPFKAIVRNPTWGHGQESSDMEKHKQSDAPRESKNQKWYGGDRVIRVTANNFIYYWPMLGQPLV